MTQLLPMSAEAGIFATQTKNERHYPGWTELATVALLDYAEQSDTPFRCEDVRRANPTLEKITASVLGWGAVFTAAAKAGKIAKAGRTGSSDNPTNHNRNVQLWVRPDLLPREPTKVERIVEEMRTLTGDELTAIFDAVVYDKPLDQALTAGAVSR